MAFMTNSCLFVLDTPAIMGSHQTAGSVPAPRVEAPSHGSHVTALIACGCDWTGVSLSPLPVIALLGAAQKS